MKNEAIGNATLYLGGCREVLPTLADESIDSIVVDPPYELGFMGKKWDKSGIAFDPDTWRHALRVLKPGGHMLAFGGSRTFHRIACAIEDAGFEIRDTIMWLYGSGMPKSKNLDGSWEGWGTALKPAFEPIILARKPLAGTVAANVLEHGTGALNIDRCRIEGRERMDYALANATRSRANTYGAPSASANFNSAAGRWPANIVHDGSDEVLAAFPQSEVSGSAKNGTRSDATPAGIFGKRPQGRLHNDAGSAARFFYCAKASRKDRDEGLDAFEEVASRNYRTGNVHNGHGGRVPDKTARNTHPTVKPTSLMRYLCRLITPPGGVVLDFFMGSGSTGKAAMLEDFSFIGVEQDEHFYEIAKARIQAATRRADQVQNFEPGQKTSSAPAATMEPCTENMEKP